MATTRIDDLDQADLTLCSPQHLFGQIATGARWYVSSGTLNHLQGGGFDVEADYRGEIILDQGGEITLNFDTLNGKSLLLFIDATVMQNIPPDTPPEEDFTAITVETFFGGNSVEYVAQKLAGEDHWTVPVSIPPGDHANASFVLRAVDHTNALSDWSFLRLRIAHFE